MENKSITGFYCLQKYLVIIIILHGTILFTYYLILFHTHHNQVAIPTGGHSGAQPLIGFPVHDLLVHIAIVAWYENEKFILLTCQINKKIAGQQKKINLILKCTKEAGKD